MLGNSKEENVTQMPKDTEAVKILLENAEIDFTEDETEGGNKYYELDGGIIFTFDQDDRLVRID